MLHPHSRTWSYIVEKLYNNTDGIRNNALTYVACQEAIGQVVCQEVLFPS